MPWQLAKFNLRFGDLDFLKPLVSDMVDATDTVGFHDQFVEINSFISICTLKLVKLHEQNTIVLLIYDIICINLVYNWELKRQKHN